ncbi:hypothetical protein NIT60_06515 [Mammaliicoccus sciuri]|nr:hypothetical protein NIT60_06515 [Mammaliicoccus sciuri]
MLICGMRHHDNQTNIDLFKSVDQLNTNNRHIVGFDFAGPEEAFPTKVIQEAYTTFYRFWPLLNIACR